MTTNVPEGTTPEAVDAIRAREACALGRAGGTGTSAAVCGVLPLNRASGARSDFSRLMMMDDSSRSSTRCRCAVWRTDTVTALSPHPNDPARTGV